jgi:hypothetical protein
VCRFSVERHHGFVFNNTMQNGIRGQRRRSIDARSLILFVLVSFTAGVAIAIENCKVCQKEIRYETITWRDEVTHTKYYLCTNCPKLSDTCYLCSLPVLKDFKTLSDGRVICNRDLKSVVIDDDEALQICKQVKENLDSQFIRFTTFPETNVTIQLMDRVRLQELYKIIGKDNTCPDTRGCTEPKTNNGIRRFEISILSGSIREEVVTTCIHEYGHTWAFENVPPHRQEKIGKDAVEGFCELLAYLYAEQNGLAIGKSNILANYYTRGQIHLFIAAEQRYGLNDIIDWMKAGDDPLLLAEDLGRVRRLVDAPSPIRSPSTNVAVESRGSALVSPPQKLPREAVLQGIMWSKAQPMAIISGNTFTAMQRGQLKLDGTNLLIRCLEIRTNSVLIQFEGSGDKQELVLPLNGRQSLGTQPLPGMKSRLPEDDLHPAAPNASTSKSSHMQIFLMPEL